ncbi:RING finger and SPRY domain-containing protein 1-like [Condylostylus longicornis]|uniref:RING finger and SPRY domain-containing protein 1-like n=1 Tax=Condylostylus longicornis TaxID=2530218 RepID=UPI00244DCCF0|nr:RING finger and SPRY domain-containing protein 1-like [Condylostylus longicornis]
MGVCLCKDKIEEGVSSIREYVEQPNGSVESDQSNATSCNQFKTLAERVDILVKETLDVIAATVDNEPEPPNSMILLNAITDKPAGWMELIRSLIRSVPSEHPMGFNVIALLLDDSPLPTKECVMEVTEIVGKTVFEHLSTERNFCVILGCLAEKLAGPSSIALLSENTLQYLVDNLSDDTNNNIKLLSIIALEKFALTSENKATIKKKIEQCKSNPLLKLEKYTLDNDYILRQIGFCARWCLDNYFILDSRKYSYEIVDTSNVNVMLNTKDVSEYLKISPDGLEARCDAYTFESVRCTFQITTGCWYYEVLVVTPGVMQIGWATKDSNFLSDDGYGIGDDICSIAFDGCRKLVWHNAKATSHNLPAWTSGSIVGCLLDLNKKECVFSINGVESDIYKQVFDNAKEGFFAAASFMSFQQCRFNFGSEPFKYPPKNRNFSNFNDNATLKTQDKIILPRHIYLEKLRKLSVREDSCTLCFDRKGVIRLEPCKHRGFCSKCSVQIQHCPMCRAAIEEIVIDNIDNPVVEDLIT